MGRTSGPSVVVLSAVAVLFAVVFTVLSLTTTDKSSKACPECKAAYRPGDVVKRPQATYFFCRQCTHSFSGPVSRDFSWARAVEHWLDE